MPTTLSKSHKSRKTDDEQSGKPRQRKSTNEKLLDRAIALGLVESSSPVDSSSSVVPATTVPLSPTTQTDVVVSAQANTVPNPPDSGGSDAQATGVPTELPCEQQPWYRKPTSSIRKQAEKIAVMDAAGRHVSYIAKKLGICEGRVRVVRYLARKNGWWDDNDEPVDIEAEMSFTTERKIVRNINASLDGQMTNWQTHEMTIAAAKGRGIFKNHDKVTVDENSKLQVVAIRIEMPTGQLQVVDEANIGGVPGYGDTIEGEVVRQSVLPSGESHVGLDPRHSGSEAHEADSATV